MPTINPLRESSYTLTNFPFINTRNIPSKKIRGYPTGYPSTMPTEQPSSNPRDQPSSDSNALKQRRPEAKLIIRGILILIIVHIISYLSSKQGSTQMIQQASLKIQHIQVIRVYHEVHALLSSTKTQISYKEKMMCVKVYSIYKAAKDSNTFFFESA